MRPKKQVLLYCATERRREVMTFALRTRCPWARITAFATLEELGAEMARMESAGLSPCGCLVLLPELAWCDAESAAIARLLLEPGEFVRDEPMSAQECQGELPLPVALRARG